MSRLTEIMQAITKQALLEVHRLIIDQAKEALSMGLSLAQFIEAQESVLSRTGTR